MRLPLLIFLLYGAQAYAQDPQASDCRKQINVVRDQWKLSPHQTYHVALEQKYEGDTAMLKKLPQLEDPELWTEYWGDRVDLEYDQPQTFQWALIVKGDAEKMWIELDRNASAHTMALIHLQHFFPWGQVRTVLCFADSTKFIFDEPYFAQPQWMSRGFVLLSGSMQTLQFGEGPVPLDSTGLLMADDGILGKILTVPLITIEKYGAESIHFYVRYKAC